MKFNRYFKLALFIFLFSTISMIQWSALLPSQTTSQEHEASVVGFSNPAAVYCKELGYEYQLKGNQGFCIFPDENICPEWDFMNGQCGVEYSSCAQHGLTLEVRTDGNNPFSQVYAVCVNKENGMVSSATELVNLDEALKPSCQKEFPVELPEMEPAAKIPEIVLNTLPSSFDWRNRPAGNFLTNVRNQAQCGSCWAFSVVGVTEAALNIANGTVGNNYDLSEQFLVTDCNSYGDCCGGYTSWVMSDMSTTGTPDESCMTYVDGTSGYDGSTCKCNSDGSCNSGCAYNTDGDCSDKACTDRCADWASRIVTVDHVGYVSNDKATIKAELIEKGPLKAAMHWGTGSFQNGIYTCGVVSGTNHAVVIVGYDDADSSWLIRNSWGPGWDGDGYFKIAYDSCNIQTSVMYGTIDPISLEAPTLTSPEDASTTPDSTPTFDWEDVANATGYVLQYADNDAFSDMVEVTISNSSYTLSEALDPGTYYWQTKTTLNNLESDWSETWSFTIDQPTVPVIIGPVDGHDTIDHTPNFDWEDVPGAISYIIQVSPDSDFTRKPVNHSVTNSFFAPGIAMINQPYYWRVVANMNGTLSGWSEVRTITITGAPGNAAPVAISPESGATTSDRTPTFSWTEVPTAVRYRIQLSPLEGFGTWVVNQTVNTPITEWTPGINFNPGTYWWRVQAEGNGDSSWFSVKRQIIIAD